MIIREGVEDDLPVAAGAHKICLAQSAKLVGYGGFAHRQKDRKVAYAHFGYVERANDAHAGGVAEHLEKIRKIDQDIFIRYAPLYHIDGLGMYHVAVAAQFRKSQKKSAPLLWLVEQTFNCLGIL